MYVCMYACMYVCMYISSPIKTFKNNKKIYNILKKYNKIYNN